MSTVPPAVAFSDVDAESAWAAWRFNCGPAALCAVTGLTPEKVRPHLGDFEQKGYTNPTLMFGALRSLGVKWEAKSSPLGVEKLEWPAFGLARIQWGGPWTKPGVPMRARYRQTHWVASCHRSPGDIGIFDVNAMNVGGWVPLASWEKVMVPWLMKECVPRADGTWWITHAVEIQGR